MAIDLIIRNQLIQEDETYRAKRNIIAGNLYKGDWGVHIEGTTDLKFKAGKKIFMLPGFEVYFGANFNAFIDPTLAQ